MKNQSNLIIIVNVLFISTIIFFSVSPAICQDWTWQKRFYGNGYESVYDLKVDNNDNILIVGSYRDSFIFPTDTFYNSTTKKSYGYLAKFDTNGTLLWLKDLDANNCSNIAIDDENNIYISGILYNNMVVGNDTLFNEDKSLLLMKLDSNGTTIWANNFGHYCKQGNSSADVLDIESFDDYIYLTGYFSDPAYFGNDTLFKENGKNFLCKIDARGNFIWTSQFGSLNNSSWSYALSVDNSANTYVTGSISSGISMFDTIVVTPLNVRNAFIAKFDNYGNCLWMHQDGAVVDQPFSTLPPYVTGYQISCDKSGNVFYCGGFEVEATFGNTTELIPKTSGFFLASYDTSGNFRWVIGDTKTNYSFSNEMTIDDNNHIYFAINYSHSVALGNNTYSSINQSEGVLIVKLNVDAKIKWAKVIELNNGYVEMDVRRCPSSNILVTGHFNYGDLWLDSTQIQYLGSQDIFLACLKNDSTACNTTTIRKYQDASHINIYPNPTDNIVNIRMNNTYSNVTITCLDITGHYIKSINAKNEEKIQIDFSDLPNGTYILNVSGYDFNFNEKIIKY